MGPLLSVCMLRSRGAQDEIMKIFALFDEDGTGGISFRNLKRVATELGENLTDDELQVRKCVIDVLLMCYFASFFLNETRGMAALGPSLQHVCVRLNPPECVLRVHPHCVIS